MTFAELKEKGSVTVPFKYRKYEDSGFKTPTGKIELYSTRFEEMGCAPLPSYEEPPESPISRPEVAEDYPLVLLAFRTSLTRSTGRSRISARPIAIRRPKSIQKRRHAMASRRATGCGSRRSAAVSGSARV